MVRSLLYAFSLVAFVMAAELRAQTTAQTGAQIAAEALKAEYKPTRTSPCHIARPDTALFPAHTRLRGEDAAMFGDQFNQYARYDVRRMKLRVDALSETPHCVLTLAWLRGDDTNRARQLAKGPATNLLILDFAEGDAGRPQRIELALWRKVAACLGRPSIAEVAGEVVDINSVSREGGELALRLSNVRILSLQDPSTNKWHSVEQWLDSFVANPAEFERCWNS